MTRRCAYRRATRAAGIPAYASDLRPVRGRCMHKRCDSRWAIVRVTIDFREARADRFAVTECAKCGRVWRRVSVPPITSRDGYQAVRLTLILPATSHRWFSRGRWHKDGDDALIVRDANIADLDEAARAHRGRCDRAEASRIRARDKREAEDLEAVTAARASLARLAERDAEREADERAAAAREAE